MSLRRAQAAEPYSTPTRLRTKFKADMVDESSDIEPFQSLQPFGVPHVGVVASAETFAPFTPPVRTRSRSPSPVEEPGEASTARCKPSEPS